MSQVRKTWQVLARRQVVRDAWMDLRAETVVTSGGATLNDFYILAPRDWAVILALTPERRAVLVRQYRHGAGIVSLELPGGVVDASDADPVAAAVRELAEETGYACGPAHLVGAFSPNPQTHANRMHVAVAHDARLAGPHAREAAEEIEVEEVALDRLADLIADGQIQHGLHIAAITLALARLMRNDG
jgi:8-oxo-dGTP pyrophosphatase MutT (NUDIX family)